MNNTARGVSLALLFILLLSMQYAVRPLLDWKAEIDFLVIGLLLVSVRVRPGTAALLGGLTGVIVDALAPLSFGAGALAFTVVAFVASWLKAVFFGLYGESFDWGKIVKSHNARLLEQALTSERLEALLDAESVRRRQEEQQQADSARRMHELLDAMLELKAEGIRHAEAARRITEELLQLTGQHH